MKWTQTLGLALQGARRTPLRVILTALGITIATGALVSMVGFALGLQSRIEEPFQRLELFNRIDVDVISDDDDDDESPPPPADRPMEIDRELLETIRDIDGVMMAYPDLTIPNIQVGYGSESVRVPVRGLPRGFRTMPFVATSIVAGRFLGEDGLEVVIADGLAEALGFDTPDDAIGKTVHLTIHGARISDDGDYGLATEELDMEVAGVWQVRGLGSLSANRLIILPIEVVETLPGIQFETIMEQLRDGSLDAKPGYQEAIVRVARPGQVVDAAEAIRELGLDTRTWLDELKEIRTAFLIMDAVLAAVGTVALVVAGLGIINTLLMAVLERKREIGVYKALGASDGDVRLLFLAEAGLVGFLGGIGGLLLGWVVSWMIEIGVNEWAESQGIDEILIVFSFPFWLLASAVLFAMAMSVVSGVYPASRAARVDPIQALRGE